MAGTAVSEAQGVQRAHADFCAYWYKPHGSFVDTQLAKNLDANGIKREFLGYALVFLAVALLCTKAAPLVATLICIVYPLIRTWLSLRGQSPDGNRFIIYWSIFGIFSLFDYYFGYMSLFWILKVTVCVFLYLPQTQGALVVYATLIEPITSRVAVRDQ